MISEQLFQIGLKVNEVGEKLAKLQQKKKKKKKKKRKK